MDSDPIDTDARDIGARDIHARDTVAEDTEDESVAIRVIEPRRVPPESLLLGGLAMVPFPLGAALAFLPGVTGAFFADLTLLWGAAVLAFLAGVRRGVSFRTMGGPSRGQLAVMLWLFGLAALSLFLVALSSLDGSTAAKASAAAMLGVGYASMIALDPFAARHGEAPLFFERLRPVQMMIPSISLVLVLISLGG